MQYIHLLGLSMAVWPELCLVVYAAELLFRG